MLHKIENFIYICDINFTTMDSASIWVLSALCSIIGFLIVFGGTQLLKRIDKIADTLEVHNDKLISILTKHEVTSQWLDNHEKEIDDIKAKQTRLELKFASHKHKS